MSGTDKQGNPYLTFDQAKAGRSVILDGDFTCAGKGARKILRKGPNNNGLYFECACGAHFLDGQADFDGGSFYVGLYPSPLNRTEIRREIRSGQRQRT